MTKSSFEIVGSMGEDPDEDARWEDSARVQLWGDDEVLVRALDGGSDTWIEQ